MEFNVNISYNRKTYTNSKLTHLYKALLYPRLIEEKMLLLLRQGRISKWFSGIGQEAIAVGCTEALDTDEFIFPLHRNLGVFTSRKMPLDRLFAQWQGKSKGYTKGRDRSFHFGNLDFGIVGMISHLGPQLTLANGTALAYLLKNEKKVCVAYTGEGGTSEGDFHEALNVASVWSLPVIFIIENNGYGLSTPTSEQYACKQLADRALGYGMEGITLDGNNILEVHSTISNLAKSLRENPRPVLVECMTFRMRGHEEASGVKYVPKKLLEEWAAKDPILNYEKWLMDEKIIQASEVEFIRTQFKKQIQEEVEKVFEWTDDPVVLEDELADVYKSFEYKESPPATDAVLKNIRFIDAIREGLQQAMRKHPDLVLMGQDIAGYGGVFKITEGFLDEFGKDRVRNTPICESAILGAALGLSLKNIKSMVEMQFADFVSSGFNQVVNNLAKIHYRWGQQADVVIRMPCGAATQAGPFHSQTNEAWFAHTPGLKIIYPSNPFDAKGLLLSAFEDPNPVLFFEHKALYRAVEGEVPDAYYTIPIGKGRLIKSGNSMTIISYGLGIQWAKELLNRVAFDADLIDLRSLVPLDYDMIRESVLKTGKVCILQEDNQFCSIGSELASWIQENCFEALDAPIQRCGSLDTPIPFVKRLEDQYLAVSRLEEKLRYLQAY
ncbi:MAG TPA: dehydrogenase E1 component subunit alpha/beta [Saprospiraceae bacterium]|nr:dehydrogenase E1 component subunit alpha/beta [Saprospiraceae bacterium]